MKRNILTFLGLTCLFILSSCSLQKPPKFDHDLDIDDDYDDYEDNENNSENNDNDNDDIDKLKLDRFIITASSYIEEDKSSFTSHSERINGVQIEELDATYNSYSDEIFYINEKENIQGYVKEYDSNKNIKYSLCKDNFTNQYICESNYVPTDYILFFKNQLINQSFNIGDYNYYSMPKNLTQLVSSLFQTQLTDKEVDDAFKSGLLNMKFQENSNIVTLKFLFDGRKLNSTKMIDIILKFDSYKIIQYSNVSYDFNSPEITNFKFSIDINYTFNSDLSRTKMLESYDFKSIKEPLTNYFILKDLNYNINPIRGKFDYSFPNNVEFFKDLPRNIEVKFYKDEFKNEIFDVSNENINQNSFHPIYFELIVPDDYYYVYNKSYLNNKLVDVNWIVTPNGSNYYLNSNFNNDYNTELNYVILEAGDTHNSYIKGEPINLVSGEINFINSYYDRIGYIENDEEQANVFLSNIQSDLNKMNIYNYKIEGTIDNNQINYEGYVDKLVQNKDYSVEISNNKYTYRVHELFDNQTNTVIQHLDDLNNKVYESKYEDNSQNRIYSAIASLNLGYSFKPNCLKLNDFISFDESDQLFDTIVEEQTSEYCMFSRNSKKDSIDTYLRVGIYKLYDNHINLNITCSKYSYSYGTSDFNELNIDIFGNTNKEAINFDLI